MRHRLLIVAFALSLLITYFFVAHTGAQLPPMTAVHFDAAGNPTSYLERARYLRFESGLAVGLPLALVILMSLVYSRARTFKVPNRDYWMAPQRAAATRSFLIGHGIGFGILLTAMMCFIHWTIVTANRSQPPHLANGLAIGGLLVLLAVALGWAMVLMVAFRRPR